MIEVAAKRQAVPQEAAGCSSKRFWVLSRAVRIPQDRRFFISTRQATAAVDSAGGLPEERWIGMSDEPGIGRRGLVRTSVAIRVPRWARWRPRAGLSRAKLAKPAHAMLNIATGEGCSAPPRPPITFRSGSVRGLGVRHLRGVRESPDRPPTVGFAAESAELTGEAAAAALPPLRRRSPRPPARTPSVPSAGVESFPTPDGRNPVQTSRSEGTGSTRPGDGEDRRAQSWSRSGRPVRRSGPASTPMARLTKFGLGLPGTGHVGRPHLVARESVVSGSGGIPQPEFL